MNYMYKVNQILFQLLLRFFKTEKEERIGKGEEGIELHNNDVMMGVQCEENKKSLKLYRLVWNNVQSGRVEKILQLFVASKIYF